MAHNIIIVDSYDHPQAFDNIPVKHRPGDFDIKCPVCKGHGRRNLEIHHHHRVKSELCDRCLGEGWLETNAATPVADIIYVPNVGPQWITRWVPLV